MQQSRKGTKTRRRSRRRRAWAGLRLGLGLSILALLAVLGFLAVTGKPMSLPDWVTERAEQRLNRGIDTGRVTLGRIDILLSPTLMPRLRVVNLGVYDRRGSEAARLNEVGVRLSKRRLLEGRLQPQLLRLSGAQISVLRRADGTFDLTLGAGAGASGPLASVLDALDAAFQTAPLAGLRRVEARQLTLTLEDSRSGRIWQVTDGEITLENAPDGLDLTLSADVFNGTEDLASAVIGFRTSKASRAASLTATFENAAARDIAAQTPALAFLSVLDAPIAGALRTTIDAEGRLERLAGSLDIGAGALQPTATIRPIRFDEGQAYVTYDPEARVLEFDEVSFRTDAAEAHASGRAHLMDFRFGWPSTLVGQLSVTDVSVQPEGVFAEPARFDGGAVDFRLRLDPFSVEVGQIALQNGDRRFHSSGHVAARPEGWEVAMDLSLNAIALDRMLALWPVSAIPGTRKWVSANVEAGAISELSGALRQAPGEAPDIWLNFNFDGAELRYMKTLPPITGASGYASLIGNSYTTVLEAGEVTAPDGGTISLAGSVFRVEDVRVKPAQARVSVAADGPLQSVLSLLDLPPFEVLSKAGRTPDIAEGRAELEAELSFLLRRRIKPPDVDYSVSGVLHGLSSDRLVKNRRVSAARLDVAATPEGLSISGPGRLDRLPVDLTWALPFGPDTGGRSRVEGRVELSQTFLDTFGIALPPGSVSGAGSARVTLDLARGRAPQFRLVSDLERLGLSLAAVGWSKPRSTGGRLEVVGRLGADPAIERFAIEAPGLSAEGDVVLGAGGAFRAARFGRVRVGGWLDAPVTLTGRGRGRAPAIAIRGGRLDLRRAAFGGNGSGQGAAGGPLEVRLDRLTVSEGISLTGFSGSFERGGGLDGRFTASINGQSPISGRLVPDPRGTAIGLQSDRAGSALAASGILRNARGGRMNVTLRPTGRDGTYDGLLQISNTRIVEAPALADLLSAISIVGLIDQMNSGGITLTDVEAEFRLSPERLTLYRSSAVGPSLGFSLDGIYDLKAGRIDMQGVVSPVYFLNAIGQIFTRRGEGLFGFNFRLTGEGRAPRVQVNPLSILTPAMFREIFRRPPPVRDGAGQ